MKEIEIPIGKLFDYTKERYGTEFPYDELQQVPFNIQIENDVGKWCNVPSLIRKRDKIYEIKTENGRTIKGAAGHIMLVDKEHNIQKRLDQIKKGEYIDYLNDLITDVKVFEEKDVYSPSIDTPSHLYKTPNGFIHHNSHTVKRAAEKGVEQWSPCERFPKKPEVKIFTGSAGGSLTPLLIFFFDNRDHMVIVLDDADGFILSTDQDVQNFIKAVLDPDGHEPSVSATIRNLANNMRRKEYISQRESIISVDTNRLKEGICGLTVNGQDLSYRVNEDEAKILYDKFHTSEKTMTLKEGFDDFFGDDEEETKPTETSSSKKPPKAGKKEIDMSGFEEIPKNWRFNSSVVFISNIDPNVTKLNSAFTSRCVFVGINLSREGFLYRAEQILPHLEMGIGARIAPEVIEWCKRESFAILRGVITSQKFRNFTARIPIRCRLDFRLLQKIAGMWLARFDEWCMSTNTADTDQSKWAEAEAAIMEDFITFDLADALSSNF